MGYNYTTIFIFQVLFSVSNTIFFSGLDYHFLFLSKNILVADCFRCHYFNTVYYKLSCNDHYKYPPGFVTVYCSSRVEFRPNGKQFCGFHSISFLLTQWNSHQKNVRKTETLKYTRCNCELVTD